MDGEVKDLAPKMQVDRYKIHDIELVVDRLQVTDDLKVTIKPKCAANIEAGKRPDVFADRWMKSKDCSIQQAIDV